MMVRSEYEHNRQLGLDRGVTQRLGLGFRINKSKLEFVLTGTLILNEEKLIATDHDEGWRMGWGLFQRAIFNPSKRLKNTNRCEFKREFEHPANEFECQETLAFFLTQAVGLQFQYNFEYEGLLGPGRTKHHEDSTQIGLVYRFGGS